jgi:hypothetical protein
MTGLKTGRRAGPAPRVRTAPRSGTTADHRVPGAMAPAGAARPPVRVHMPEVHAWLRVPRTPRHARHSMIDLQPPMAHVD